ncbi:hypothetical protein LTR94_028403, partial [Friedmanniomyces endolithicus]
LSYDADEEMILTLTGGGDIRLSDIDWRPGLAQFKAELDDEPFTAEVKRTADGFDIRHRAAKARVRVLRPNVAELYARLPEKQAADTSKLVLSPMPGLVVAIPVVVGQEVKTGETVAVIEAMKMQNILKAERDGVVKAVGAKDGDPVAADDVLWREAAIKALKERPLESLIHLDADHLATKPLYGAANGGEPVFAPRPSDSEGRAWDVRALNEGEDAEALNRAILTDLENGAASVLIAGPVAADAVKLARALDGVALELAPVALDAGFDGVKAPEALSAVAKGSPRAKLAFHLDPISAY